MIRCLYLSVNEEYMDVVERERDSVCARLSPLFA